MYWRAAAILGAATPLSAAQSVRWLRPEVLVFSLAWLGLILAGRSRLFQDPGTFWHIVAGEQILSDGSTGSEVGRVWELPRHDKWTYTHAGQPWIAQQWLGECAMAALYRQGGFDALLWATAACLAGLFTWLFSRLHRSGLHPLASVMLLVIGMAACSHHFHVRPHLATLVGLPLVYGLLLDCEAGRVGISRLWWLVPLVALWANIHGGVLGGLVTLGLVIGGWQLASMCGAKSPLGSRRERWLAAIIGPACLAAVLINPYGLRLPQVWLTIMRLELPELIEEHAPLNWHRPEGWMVGLLAVVYAGLLLSCLWKNKGVGSLFLPAMRSEYRKPSLRQKKSPDPLDAAFRVAWLVPALWLLLADGRVRHAPLFAVVAMLAIAEMLPRSPLVEWLAKHEWLTSPHENDAANDSNYRISRLVAGAVPILLCLVLIQSTTIARARLDPAVWPVRLVEPLRQLRLESRHGRLFNSLPFGGFVTLFVPEWQTFIDDRCELFGNNFLQAYSEAESTRPQQIEVWQRQYGFDAGLVRSGGPLDCYLSEQPDWQLIERTAAAALYRFVPHAVASP